MLKMTKKRKHFYWCSFFESSVWVMGLTYYISIHLFMESGLPPRWHFLLYQILCVYGSDPTLIEVPARIPFNFIENWGRLYRTPSCLSSKKDEQHVELRRTHQQRIWNCKRKEFKTDLLQTFIGVNTIPCGAICLTGEVVDWVKGLTLKPSYCND